MFACNAHSCGTGFSREGGISDDKYRVDELASSRLKPVPLMECNLCGTGFSREGGISGDSYRGNVQAPSRLKPVPQDRANLRIIGFTQEGCVSYKSRCLRNCPGGMPWALRKRREK